MSLRGPGPEGRKQESGQGLRSESATCQIHPILPRRMKGTRGLHEEVSWPLYRATNPLPFFADLNFRSVPNNTRSSTFYELFSPSKIQVPFLFFGLSFGTQFISSRSSTSIKTGLLFFLVLRFGICSWKNERKHGKPIAYQIFEPHLTCLQIS